MIATLIYNVIVDIFVGGTTLQEDLGMNPRMFTPKSLGFLSSVRSPRLIRHSIVVKKKVQDSMMDDDPQMAVCQNLVPLVNIKIAGKWMFIPLKMVLIGIDPYPNICGGFLK